jgi:acyl-CoA synthetase (AMP-forming)/AMP-acid ligase II
MIISGGFNVFSREVEDALTSHDAVAMAPVFGLPDEKWCESVTAAVVLRPGAAATPEELTDHVRELKGAVQAPKSVHLLDALPTTAVWKVDKKAFRSSLTPGGGYDMLRQLDQVAELPRLPAASTRRVAILNSRTFLRSR